MSDKPVSGEHYIQLDVSVAALRKMLERGALHISDIHCPSAKSKAELQQLLLKTLIAHR